MTMPVNVPPDESTVCPNGALNASAHPVMFVNVVAESCTGALNVTSPAGAKLASGIVIFAPSSPPSNVYAVSQAESATEPGATAPFTVTVAHETPARSPNITASPL